MKIRIKTKRHAIKQKKQIRIKTKRHAIKQKKHLCQLKSDIN
jgi:hypothetical protein